MSFIGDIFKGVGKVATGAVGGLVSGGPLGLVTGAVHGAESAFAGDPAPAPAIHAFPSTPPDTSGGFSGIKLGPLELGTHFPATPAPTGTQPVHTNGGGTLPIIGRIGFKPRTIGILNSNKEHPRPHPIKRCPRGYVLAVDKLCYPRRMVARQWRKWPPRRKPPISRREYRAILDAAAGRKKAEKVAKKAGLHVTRGRRSK